MAERTSQQRASGAAAHRFHERVGAWKAKLADTRQRLRDGFFAREAPAELLRGHSAAIDRQLKEVWASQSMPRDAVLAAVGGYGRGQLFPSSDIDLLILVSAPPADRFARKLEDLVGILWDIGLEVGHSVRTIEECIAGATREAARALGLFREIGSLEAGKYCDLAIWSIEQPADLVYRMGFNPLHARVWRGQ